MTYVWILTVTYLYSSMTATVTTPAAYVTREACTSSKEYINADQRLVIAECRAVKLHEELTGEYHTGSIAAPDDSPTQHGNP